MTLFMPYIYMKQVDKICVWNTCLVYHDPWFMITWDGDVSPDLVGVIFFLQAKACAARHILSFHDSLFVRESHNHNHLFFSCAVSIPHLFLLFFFLFCLILAPYFSSVYDQITTISPTTEVQHLHLVVAVYINVTSIVIYRLNTVLQVRLVSTCSTCSSPATNKMYAQQQSSVRGSSPPPRMMHKRKKTLF